MHHNNSFLLHYLDNIQEFCGIEYYDLNKKIFKAALHGLGVLNHGDFSVSGENYFMNTYLKGRMRPIVFDIGANRGKYAAAVRKIVHDSIVYAFEPNKTAYLTLKEKARTCRFFSFPIGMSNVENETILYDRRDSIGSVHASIYESVIKDIHHTDSIQQKIMCTTIDDFVERIEISYIDLIKIDTEGHELAIIKGAANSLNKGMIGAFQIEFNEMNVHSHTFLRDFQIIMPEYEWFRLLPNGMVPLANEPTVIRELFAVQNLVALHRAH